MEKMSWFEEWVLPLYVKVEVGKDTAVIYDFKRYKAYQVSKFMGVLLTTMFPNSHTPTQSNKHWILSQINKLPDTAFARLNTTIAKLKGLGVLMPLYEHHGEDRANPVQSDVPSKPPQACIIELTSRCNFFCGHCYQGKKSPYKDIAFETVSRLLRQIRRMGIQNVQLTGREIFLRPDLADLILAAYNLGLQIAIATNGSLISDELLDVVTKYVTKAKITLYGLTRETYSYFSREGSVFDRVIRTIEELRRRNPSILELTFTITPDNYHETSEFCRFAEERGIEYSIGKTLPIGLACREKMRKALANPQYEKFVEEFERTHSRKPSYPFRVYACKPDKLTILSDGRVTICPLTRSPEFTLGSIYEQPLMAIWYEKAIPHLRSLHVDNFEICQDCELKYLCGGGCPAFWSLKEGFPSCRIYSNRKYILRECQI